MQQLTFPFPIPDGYELVFRPHRTLKDGRVIYAKHYGKRAFPMLVRTK
jgi:hypothetical protein